MCCCDTKCHSYSDGSPQRPLCLHTRTRSPCCCRRHSWAVRWIIYSYLHNIRVAEKWHSGFPPSIHDVGMFLVPHTARSPGAALPLAPLPARLPAAAHPLRRPDLLCAAAAASLHPTRASRAHHCRYCRCIRELQTSHRFFVESMRSLIRCPLSARLPITGGAHARTLPHASGISSRWALLHRPVGSSMRMPHDTQAGSMVECRPIVWRVLWTSQPQSTPSPLVPAARAPPPPSARSLAPLRCTRADGSPLPRLPRACADSQVIGRGRSAMLFLLSRPSALAPRYAAPLIGLDTPTIHRLLLPPFLGRPEQRTTSMITLTPAGSILLIGVGTTNHHTTSLSSDAHSLGLPNLGLPPRCPDGRPAVGLLSAFCSDSVAVPTWDTAAIAQRVIESTERRFTLKPILGRSSHGRG